MKFVVRDDDTCGFTRVEELQDCYAQIWEDVPVSLSVTPFRIPGDDWNLPPALAGSMEALPLHENTELVGFLREGIRAGRIDIAMHGYHHLHYHGQPEYVGGSELMRKTAAGRAYLEQWLGTRVRTFVPPHNTISLEALQAIVAAHMNLVNIPSLVRRALDRDRIPSLRDLAGYVWHCKVKHHRYPYVLDLCDHKEVGYHTVGPRSERKSLFQELRYCHAQDGVFVLATHYHAFARQTRDGGTVGTLLSDLLDAAKGMPGVSFVGVNSIW